MIKLHYLTATRFHGSDAGNFLHNQLSADVLGLDDGASTFACYCEPKGRVLALLLVNRAGDDYYVIMSGELSTAVIARLKIYVMRSKVDIDILSEYAIGGLRKDDVAGPPLDSAATIQVPGSDLWLVITDREIPGWEDEAQQKAWKHSELQQGITWLNGATSAQFLPQMLGFDQLGAVNYRKGCYPGQEIVARTRYLGKVKRHPRLLNCELAMCPQPMDKVTLHDDEKAYAGNVVDCVEAADGSYSLLAVVRMDPDLTARRIEYLNEITAVL